jgi:Fe2+ transport system protein FeoA
MGMEQTEVKAGATVSSGAEPTRLKDKEVRIARLGDLRPGEAGVIQKLACRRQLRRRLMDMGVVAGTLVEVERVAPLGDPIELKLKGFHLSLRRDEASEILVEVQGDEL